MILCQEYWETGWKIKAHPKAYFLALTWHFLTLSIVPPGLSGPVITTFLLQIFHYENKLLPQR